MNAETAALVRKLSKTMKGIPIITAAQPTSESKLVPPVNGFKGPIIFDYMGLLRR